MRGFLAYIMPVDSGAHPEHPIVIPPPGGGQPPGGGPPGIWGPTDPRPTPPIYWPGYPGGGGGGTPPGGGGSPGVPTHPIYWPPVISGGPGSLPPYPMPPIYYPPSSPGVPTHPIVIPPEPTEPPTNPTEPKPPPADGGWGWHPEYGWGFFPPNNDKPRPITPPATPAKK